MVRILNIAVCCGCGILAALCTLQFTGCTQVDQLKNRMGSQMVVYDAGDKALAEGDRVAAAAHYRKTAAAGDPLAQFNLGLLSADGGDVPQNDAEAHKWMRMSAEQGYAPAQQTLGTWYFAGGITPYNPTEASVWFRKAAEQNDASAMYFLGVMHARGEGVAKDYNAALEWFQSASAKGFPVPSDNLTMDGVVALDRPGQSVQDTPAQTSQPVVKSRQDTVKEVQTGLADLGYDPGPVNGMMGEKTAEAIRDFQWDNDMQMDGKISEHLMRRIKEKL